MLQELSKGGVVLSTICRFGLVSLLLMSTPVSAFDNRSLWSNEFQSSDSQNRSTEDYIPLTWGIDFSGSIPRSENDERLFSLASVKKMVTAATALRELGSDFKFNNEFTGELDEAQAAIYSPSFSVSGDPTWGHEAYGETLRTRVSKVVQELKKLKVKRVVGEIKINLLKPAIGQFSRPKGWKPSWLLECYASLPTTVMLNGNCAQLAVYPDKRAFWITEGVSTPIENNLVVTAEDSLSIVPVLDSLGKVSKYILNGGMSRPSSVYLPVHSNEEWLKALFIKEVRTAGIAYYAKPSKWIHHSNLTPVFIDLASKNLKEMLIPFLQDSINIVGERLHIEAPSDLLTLASMLPDSSDYENVTLVDGSGLMAANQMSPKTFYRFLAALQNQPYFQDLYAGLPVAGVSGTLRNRMNTDMLRNRIHAKTGTIDHVVNLAGYWLKQDQTLEPFVVFSESSLSSSNARKLVDGIVDDFARKN